MIGNTHALARLATRVPEAERSAILTACEAALAACRKRGIADAAIRVYRADTKRTCADGSNGQVAVLLVRHGEAATIMWRRLTQRHTRDAYSVASVQCMRGTCSGSEHAEHK